MSDLELAPNDDAVSTPTDDSALIQADPRPGWWHKLTDERVAGMLLLLGAAIALIWANSPFAASYDTLTHSKAGVGSFSMSLSHWAADGLLAVFFFVVGVELKHEFSAGALRDLKVAAVPMIAAAAGMAVPALFYVGVQVIGNGDMAGWAVPTATDIAFAIALLAIIGRGLPPAVRLFLLTLAVVDDLLAIIIIAAFFAKDLNLLWLLGTVVGVIAFRLAIRQGWWLLLPIAAATWGCMYLSGIHATIAGVLLGMVVPARGKGALTHRFADAVEPISNTLALPVFAFFSAGVSLGSVSITSPVLLGIVLGLVFGKIVGIWGSVMILSKFGMPLGKGITGAHVFGVGSLAGIGFTVSLLLAELSFPQGAADARFAVLLASLLAAVLASLIFAIQRRSRA